MMKRRWAVLAALFVALALALPGWAAGKTDGNMKIGVIDIQRIMRESKAVKKVRDSFQQEVQAKKETMSAKEKEVKNLEEEFKSAKAKLPAEALKEKGEQLAKEGKELKRLRDDLTEELKKENSELTRKVIGEIVATAKDLLKKEHYAVILERNSVVAAGETVDITDELIKLYDGKK
jgi:outer membrane protein